MSKAGKIFLILSTAFCSCDNSSNSDSGLLDEDNFFNSEWTQITPTNNGHIRYREKDFRDTTKYMAIPGIKVSKDSIHINMGTGWLQNFGLKNYKKINDNSFIVSVDYDTNHGKGESQFFLSIYDKKENLIIWEWEVNHELTSGGSFGRRWLMVPTADTSKYELIVQGTEEDSIEIKNVPLDTSLYKTNIDSLLSGQ